VTATTKKKEFDEDNGYENDGDCDAHKGDDVDKDHESWLTTVDEKMA